MATASHIRNLNPVELLVRLYPKRAAGDVVVITGAARRGRAGPAAAAARLSAAGAQARGRG